VTEFKVDDRVLVSESPEVGKYYIEGETFPFETRVLAVTSWPNGDCVVAAVDGEGSDPLDDGTPAWYVRPDMLSPILTAPAGGPDPLEDYTSRLRASAEAATKEVHIDTQDAKLMVALGEAFAASASKPMVDHGEIVLTVDVGGVYRCTTDDGEVWAVERLGAAE